MDIVEAVDQFIDHSPVCRGVERDTAAIKVFGTGLSGGEDELPMKMGQSIDDLLYRGMEDFLLRKVRLVGGMVGGLLFGHVVILLFLGQAEG